jgi:hypothetical protein
VFRRPAFAGFVSRCRVYRSRQAGTRRKMMRTGEVTSSLGEMGSRRRAGDYCKSLIRYDHVSCRTKRPGASERSRPVGDGGSSSIGAAEPRRCGCERVKRQCECETNGFRCSRIVMADVEEVSENSCVAPSLVPLLERRCDVCVHGECAWIGHPIPRWLEWLLWMVSS